MADADLPAMSDQDLSPLPSDHEAPRLGEREASERTEAAQQALDDTPLRATIKNRILRMSATQLQAQPSEPYAIPSTASKTTPDCASQASQSTPRTYKNYYQCGWPSPFNAPPEKFNKDDPTIDWPVNPEGEVTMAVVLRVSDMGFPISGHGIANLVEIIDQCRRRDQDRAEFYQFEDFTGYGINEVVENMIKKFDYSRVRKGVPIHKKWAIPEALFVYFKIENVKKWLKLADGEHLKETIDMLGTLLLDMLQLLSTDGILVPDTSIPNIAIICALALEFVEYQAADLDMGWGFEIVRLLDQANITIPLRKQLQLTSHDVEGLRALYKAKERLEGSLYDKAVQVKNWTPKDDMDEQGERIWARWEWKTEYKIFKRTHGGGDMYDLQKGYKLWTWAEDADGKDLTHLPGLRYVG